MSTHDDFLRRASLSTLAKLKKDWLFARKQAERLAGIARKATEAEEKADEAVELAADKFQEAFLGSERLIQFALTGSGDSEKRLNLLQSLLRKNKVKFAYRRKTYDDGRELKHCVTARGNARSDSPSLYLCLEALADETCERGYEKTATTSYLIGIEETADQYAARREREAARMERRRQRQRV